MILKVVPTSLPRRAGLAAGFSGGTPSAGPDASTRSPERGGTLLEALLATIILAIMGAAIAASINYGMFMLRLARENARATQVLIERTEALRLYNWDQLVYSNGFVPSTFTAVYDPQAGTNNQGAVFNGTMTISNVAFNTSYSTNVRQCTITLQWVTAGKINHNRSLTTYIAKNGLQNYVY